MENNTNPPPRLTGQTKFRQQRFWNAVDDAADLTKKEGNVLLKEINSSLKAIEKRLERIEDLLKYRVFHADSR